MKPSETISISFQMDYLGFLVMNHNLFLMNQVILTMDYKNIYWYYLFFYTSTTFNKIIYNKNNLIITNIDLNNYKQIYKNNYDLDIDNNSALKDLILLIT